MFNGIIEDLGTISNLSSSREKVGKVLTIKFNSLKIKLEEMSIGDSIAIDGTCTTVIETDAKSSSFSCFVSKETLNITNLSHLQTGHRVNLERALPYQGRINGHLIYGHIDGKAKLIRFKKKKGDEEETKDSWLMEFEVTNSNTSSFLLIPKGAIAINGISLTIYEITDRGIVVMIIPHTYSHTNLHLLELYDEVNIEFDIMAKYLDQYFKNNILKNIDG